MKGRHLHSNKKIPLNYTKFIYQLSEHNQAFKGVGGRGGAFFASKWHFRVQTKLVFWIFEIEIFGHSGAFFGPNVPIFQLLIIK